MAWEEPLSGALVGLDTAPLIYYIEARPDYVRHLDPLFDALDRGEFSVVTSVVTLLEVLVHPIARGDSDLAERYRSILLESRGMSTLPLTAEIAVQASQLQANYVMRTPDAIQLATAVHAGATYFLTNDQKLPSLPHIQMLVLDSLRSVSDSGDHPTTLDT